MNSAMNTYWVNVYNERKEKIEEAVEYAFPEGGRGSEEAKNLLLRRVNEDLLKLVKIDRDEPDQAG